MKTTTLTVSFLPSMPLSVNSCLAMSGHITSAQSEFDRLVVKVVCTAFSVFSTLPTKNAPCFEADQHFETSLGKNLHMKLCDKFKAQLVDQIERMSNVMIREIKHYQRDRGIPSSVKMWSRKSYDYVHYVHKIEDVYKMVGCNRKDGTVVTTW